MENEQENLDSTNETEKTENQEETTEKSEETHETESVDDLKKKISTLEAQKEHWRKKAEKTPEVPKEETPKNEMSLKDYKALSDIHEDDVDDVVEWARFKKITIAEAKNSDHIQALLKDKGEKRQIAEGTNTGGSKRVNTQNTGSEVLAKFEKTGQLPESDKDMELLAKAQFDRKLKK